MLARWGTKARRRPCFERDNCQARKLDVCIQVLAHGLRELERLNRFGEKVDAFLQRKILAGNFRAVTAHINYLQFGIFLQKPFGQILSRHAAGHDQISQQ